MKKILIITCGVLILIGGIVYGAMSYYAKNESAIQGAVAVRLMEYAVEHPEFFQINHIKEGDIKSLLSIGQNIFVADGRERSYLILLQNNMELRPGGGFIGQYATLTMRDGEVIEWIVADANHLDRDIQSDIIPPAPLAQYLQIAKLKFRDSNWDADFPTNAKSAQEFYNKGPDQQIFDGIIAVNASLLEDVLKLVGPVVVPGYEKNGAFTAENVLIQLQDVVEKPFLLAEMREECVKREKETGIEEVCNTDPETGEKIKKVTHADRENRKQILPIFAKEIVRGIFGDETMSPADRYRMIRDRLPLLAGLAVENLDDRDMQIWFKENAIQDIVTRAKWDNRFDTAWQGDYVQVVDANVGALKTDYYIKRRLEYTIDFTGTGGEVNDIAAGRMVRYRTPAISTDILTGGYKADGPLATMRMVYDHTAERENYRTTDYHSYTRLFVPEGSRWQVREWFGIPDIYDDLDEATYGNKEAFGYKFDIFIGDTLPTMLQYVLPEQITQDAYTLKIQKQSGTEDMQTMVKIILDDGRSIEEAFTMKGDVTVSLDHSGAVPSLEVEHL